MGIPKLDSIRSKAIFHLSILFAVILGVIFFAMRVYAYESSRQLEYDNAELQIKRIENAFSFVLDSMERSVRDWAQWDDAYAYLQGTNPTFADDNLYYGAFESLDYDILLIYYAEGDLYFSRQFDFVDETETDVDDAWLEAIGTLGISDNEDTLFQKSGIVTTSEGTMLLASSAVTPSIPIEESALGNMVFGRFLDDFEIAYLNGIVELPFTLFPNAGITIDEPLTIEVLSNDTLVIRQLILDLNEHYDILIEVSVPRDIAQFISRSTSFMFFAITLATLALSTFILIILDKQVFVSLTRLTNGIKEIAEYSDFTGRLVINESRNEITYVSKEINSMLDKLEMADREINKLAYLDHLTGSTNRLRFYQILETEILQSHQSHTKLSVLFLDLDGFKKINDVHGHDVGDQLLIEVSHRLAAHLNTKDVLARTGGDEFLILSHLQDVQACEALCNQLIRALDDEFTLQDLSLHITTSIGVAMYPEDGLNKDSLIKNADIAMYKAKEAGKNTHRFYCKRDDTLSN